MNKGDFPGDIVDKNPPANAGGTGSIPGRETKIPHAEEQLSPRATLLSFHVLEPVLHNKRSHRKKKSMHRHQEQPLLTTRESRSTPMKTHRHQKKLIFKNT